MLIDLVRDRATCRLSERCQTLIKEKKGTKPKQMSHFVSLLNMVSEKTPLYYCIQLHARQCALCCKLGVLCAEGWCHSRSEEAKAKPGHMLSLHR